MTRRGFERDASNVCLRMSVPSINSAVQSEILDFGFEMQDSSNFKIFSGFHSQVDRFLHHQRIDVAGILVIIGMAVFSRTANVLAWCPAFGRHPDYFSSPIMLLSCTT